MSGVYSMTGGPTYTGATGGEWMQDALDTPLSLYSTLEQSAKTGVLESFGLGTAIRHFTMPEEAPTTPGITADPGERDFLKSRWETPEELAARRQSMGALSEDQYKASPYFRNDIPYDPGMTEARAQALAASDDAKKARDYFSQKRPFWSFVGGLGGQALDPINYIPVFGEAVQSAQVARFGYVGGRLLTTAADAAINTGVASIATAGERAKFGDDVSWQTTISQIATAALLGGAFGALHGVIGGRAEARALSEADARLSDLKTTQEARIALNEGIDAVVRGEDVNLSPNATEPLQRVADSLGPVEPSALFEPSSPESRQAAIDRIVNEDMPVGAAPPQPVSLMQFLASKSVGGIKDDGGELATMGLSRKFVPGGGALVTKRGKGLDYAREAAAEAGFFDHIYGDPETAVAKSTTRDLLDMLSAERDGQPGFSNRLDGGRKLAHEQFAHDQGAQDSYRRVLDEVNGALDTLGIEHKVDDNIIRRAAQLTGQDNLDPATALEHAIYEDYRKFADAMDERGQGFSNEPAFNIPFFDEPGSASRAGQDVGAQGSNGAQGRRGTNAPDSEQFARSSSNAGQARVDTAKAAPEPLPEGHAKAQASIAKPEDAKTLAAQYGVDANTGAFKEEADITQLADEGRLTEQDVATMAQAHMDYEVAEGYAEALKSVANCLI
ncbi:hypothetical protein EN858_15020 [Mesorhizobium sp. M4B.F.Ca.ET.215.01.1.1]|uniref:hypothetical protein n=1 Tax=unclassified Mesorhizobium TaxID=325217 RepID=UPI001093B40E|nr:MULTISPECIES: hypothetical protein [unclassified Mesorhizobium]TGQ11231.1 hypothetical protein EN858_15020 [Mesorhizobium sp. M4B.F.Ca.ET.215.01.1.1]TGR04716.1 hypothetical protein EN846_13060 [Mesorhizobium sp. M4B.F.Ca.ET.203.01.1.1]